MKRAIRPAALALLALVLCAAAPAPDVRAAPPRTVPHGICLMGPLVYLAVTELGKWLNRRSGRVYTAPAPATT